ncbi:MAG: serine/threonine-protein kinase [Planctomycetaceae bacterium]|nr:serine/threonine protein kinase [Planctomycetaceae bacterium]
MKFMFSAGDQPFAGYTIKRAIHRGGFGEVYYAQTSAGKDVALKLLHDNREVELRGVSQCLNLKHPHLVTLFDVKTDAEGDQWVVMEYVAGETLADYIRRHPEGLPVEEVRRIFTQVASALEFLHARSLVHRDLKPANIFLEEGQVKLGDVGLSKFIGPSQRSAQTQSVGTVHYMAPELAKGNYGAGVDLYALGVILFEMLTGRVPFEGESTGEILMKHLTQAPDLSLVEPRFRPLLARALEKEERRRFASIAEFSLAFDQVWAHSPPRGGAAVDAMPPISASPAPGTGHANGHAYPESPRPLPSFENTNQTPSLPVFLPGDGSWWWLAGMVALLLLSLKGNIVPGMKGSAWAMIAMLLATIYCYRRFNRSNTPAAAQARRDNWADPHAGTPPANPPTAPRETLQTPRVRGATRFMRPAKTGKGKVALLLLSLSAIPLLVILITATILFFSREFFASVWLPHETDPAHVGFFVASTTLACWMLLCFTSFQRRRYSDHSHKRFLLFFAGVLTGVGIWGLSEYFLVQFPSHIFPRQATGWINAIGRHDLAAFKPTGVPRETSWPDENQVGLGEMPARLQIKTPAADGVVLGGGNKEAESGALGMETTASRQESWPDSSWAPTLFGYAIFFGMFFAWRGWSGLVDIRRLHRFQWVSVACSAGLAYLICMVFTFPAVWGLTWAAAITAAVQLAAPCESQ